MSAPLPEALRSRFQRYVEEGLSGRAAALRLKLSPATGARWALAIRLTGRAEAAPQGRPKGKGKLDPHRAFFAEIIEQDGDITMPEVSAALIDAKGLRAHPNAIGKFLRKFHMKHHYQDGNAYFGISNPFWDLVFGTYHSKRSNRSSPSQPLQPASR